VLLDTADADGTWSTIGVSENIIEASWQALVDSVVFGLVRAAARASTSAQIATLPGEADSATIAVAEVEAS
jgi:hypothetical protein